jgi:hypothetical protein
LLPRLHIWLGWIIAVPLLLWTASGLFMVSFPIEEVRGTHLRADPPPLTLTAPPVPPLVVAGAVEKMTMQQRVDGPVWVVHFATGDMRAASVTTGAILPRVDAALARRIANAALSEPASISGVSAFAAVDAPIDLRRERPAWQISYADGVRVYVDALTGDVLAVRSRLWRAFDVMWGLHIMDLQTREDTHHPLLTGFAALAFGSVLLGTVLLFRRRRAPVQNREHDGDQRG